MSPAKYAVTAACLLSASNLPAQQPPQTLWKNSRFAMYANSVQQGAHEAKALSATRMTSNYKSPANLYKSATISFKFSINGKDNEMTSGVDHHFVVTGNRVETPVIKFGQQLKEAPATPASFLPPDARLKIRLDLRAVFSAFQKDGFYTLFNGEKLYKDDFKSVYVAGNTAPLIWDFNNLHGRPQLELKDPDGDGIYETELLMNAKEDEKSTDTQWQLSKDIAPFPQYHSPYLLSDAIYNLSLEEMVKAVEPDSTFRTGKEWAGVWTRDISYSIILSMAHLQPRVAMNSLRRKVSKKKKIIQDTGTGGAWPCSTDRMIWAVAAWEIYKVTGDQDWLAEAYTIITNSLEDDYATAYNAATGMVKGESSFLDWREQTYPAWMQPVDIYQSENLGTNAVHCEANIVAGNMASLLNKKDESAKYRSVALKIKNGINTHLWMPAMGYYAQYLYGRTALMASPKAEALGEALCVLFGIADGARAVQVVRSTPVNDFGIPCIYPQIPGIPPYHNNAMWPFVQTYYMWAAAKTGNEAGVMESIAAIYRAAALFLTNKENLVVENGDYQGTQINSSNMLWSLSGNLSIIHKVLFGIRFNEADLSFSPFVPKALEGKRSLINFTYRKAVLDVEMEGYGNAIASFSLDGNVLKEAVIPSTLTGRHSIKIMLKNSLPKSSINTVGDYTALPAPAAILEGRRLSWTPVKGAAKYQVFKDGRPFMNTAATEIRLTDSAHAEYAVAALDQKGFSSFASEPVAVETGGNSVRYEVEAFASKAAYGYKGFSGSGFTEVSTRDNTVIKMPVTVREAATYLLDCRYANGNGPINTENKCAIRTVKVDGRQAGVFVLPQRGTGEWSNWGYSNTLQVALSPGDHTVSIEYLPANENMNEVTNQAMLDFVRVIRKK